MLKYIFSFSPGKLKDYGEFSDKTENFLNDTTIFNEKKVESKQEVSDFSTDNKNRIVNNKPTALKGKVNINIAGIKELSELPGIGKKTAQRIIDYRNKSGSFKTYEGLLKVKGIGKKKLEKLKSFIKLNN